MFSSAHDQDSRIATRIPIISVDSFVGAMGALVIAAVMHGFAHESLASRTRSAKFLRRRTTSYLEESMDRWPDRWRHSQFAVGLVSRWKSGEVWP
jgi:hypothetical protein